MSDPFEVRMRFIALLKSLNASQAAAHKAAQLALKHKDMLEDLHSCILEQLNEKNSTVNSRANIMCFVEVYMDAAKTEGNQTSIKMMQRDLTQIVHLVARRADLASTINAPLAKLVISNMYDKGLVLEDMYRDLTSYLAESEELVSESVAKTYDMAAKMAEDSPSLSGGSIVPDAMDKRQVEQRVEEDRERHKRLRENIWAITEEEEVAKLWEGPTELDEDDYRLMQEESEERYRSIAVCPTHGRDNMKDFADVEWSDGYIRPRSPSPAANPVPDATPDATADTVLEMSEAAPEAGDGPGVRFDKPPPRGPSRPHRGYPKHPRGSSKHPRGNSSKFAR